MNYSKTKLDPKLIFPENQRYQGLTDRAQLQFSRRITSAETFHYLTTGTKATRRLPGPKRNQLAPPTGTRSLATQAAP